MSDFPQEFYHPQDRPTLYLNSQVLDIKADAAIIPRSLRYSLATTEMEDLSPLQLHNREVDTPKVQARWSLSDQYDPSPLDVG